VAPHSTGVHLSVSVSFSFFLFQLLVLFFCHSFTFSLTEEKRQGLRRVSLKYRVIASDIGQTDVGACFSRSDASSLCWLNQNVSGRTYANKSTRCQETPRCRSDVEKILQRSSEQFYNKLNNGKLKIFCRWETPQQASSPPRPLASQPRSRDPRLKLSRDESRGKYNLKLNKLYISTFVFLVFRPTSLNNFSLAYCKWKDSTTLYTNCCRTPSAVYTGYGLG